MPTTLNVLIVDDSPYDRGMVRRELRQAFDHVEIHEVTNGVEFHEALDGGDFELVITDFQIRWTDGLKVLRAVKERTPDCPVIMFTATGSEEIAVKAMKNGLDDYVIKNAEHMIRLRTAIESALRHCRTQVRVDQLESRLESLLSHLQVGVFRRKPGGTIIEANDAAAAILGHRSSAELIGRKLDDYLNHSASQLHPPLVHGDPVSQATRIDGKTIWFAVSENMSTGDDGEPLFEGLLEDVSQHMEAEAELLDLQDQMAHVSRINVMAEMAAGISHELNQPLMVISSYAALCQDRIESAGAGFVELSGWLQQIQDLAIESAEVIRGLNEFTLKRPRQPKPINLGDLIKDTVKMMQFELRKSGVPQRIDIDDKEIIVELDPIQIRQVLLNLIRNAVEAMAATEKESRLLSITATRDSNSVEVCVADCGPGFSAEQMAGLFQSYVTTKQNGTGIGLMISSRIIDAHHGVLDARNNEGPGATLRFKLPLTLQCGHAHLDVNGAKSVAK